uniref:Uncharacterized protein n=1 Tax=Sphaerodactylus townsendi TaxID=933632 RepID=A0ACB8ERZ6_9SAUR
MPTRLFKHTSNLGGLTGKQRAKPRYYTTAEAVAPPSEAEDQEGQKPSSHPTTVQKSNEDVLVRFKHGSQRWLLLLGFFCFTNTTDEEDHSRPAVSCGRETLKGQ